MIKPWLSLLVLCCFITIAHGADFIALEQKKVGNELIITPKFNIKPSQKVIDAIDNGIVITFVVQAKLNQSVDWWFDTIVSSKILSFQVRYFSLSSQYQLDNLQNKEKTSFIDLPQLLKHLGQQTSFVFNTNSAADHITTRIFLDKQALPSIMQLPNVFDADWNLNSDWHTTPLLEDQVSD